MSNKFYVVPLMALLDAVHADGVSVCGVAGVTSVQKQQKSCENAARTAPNILKDTGVERYL